MKKLLALSLGMFFISGCLVRTYTIYKPRIHTTVSGNRGYIVGNPPKGEEQHKKHSLGKMRPITVFEVELGSHIPQYYARVPKKTFKIEENHSAEVKGSSASIEEEINKGGETQQEAVAVSPAAEKPKTTYRYYVVRKNDTLQKISRKFYGTTKRWKLIYEENKGVIKSSDRVYPGIKIRIPRLK